MKKNKIYLRDYNRHPVGVLMCMREGDFIRCGLSMCSKVDRFDRDVGTEIALKKLEENPFYISVPDAFNTKTLWQKIAEMETHFKIPWQVSRRWYNGDDLQGVRYAMRLLFAKGAPCRT